MASTSSRSNHCGLCDKDLIINKKIARACDALVLLFLYEFNKEYTYLFLVKSA